MERVKHMKHEIFRHTYEMDICMKGSDTGTQQGSNTWERDTLKMVRHKTLKCERLRYMEWLNIKYCQTYEYLKGSNWQNS